MINTLTINPAIDHNLCLKNIEKGITNRVYNMYDTLGGKGIHVSMNLSQMGIRNRAFGVSGGITGKKIINALQQYDILTYFTEKIGSENRTNYILIEDNHVCTTIAERGPELNNKDIQELCSVMLDIIQPGDTLVLSGDASNCNNSNIYYDIANMFNKNNVRIILDVSGDTLRHGLKSKPYMIKPNEDELATLCGFPMKTDDSVIRGIDTLQNYGIEVIAVSLGKRGSIVRFSDHTYRVYAPSVTSINTNGCGDCFLSGLLYGLEKNWSYKDTLRYACATSAATAASELSVGYDKDLAESLMDKVIINKI